MKCPGQDTQYWSEDAIYEVSCPRCEAMVEFYKDDTTRKCIHCHHRFVNPRMDFGCAAYCQFAEQCLGTLPEEFVAERHNLFKDKVALEVKKYFSDDFKNIRYAAQAGSFAEQLGRQTEGVDLAALLCSAYLLPVVYPHTRDDAGNEERKRSSPPDIAAAEGILQNLGADKDLITRTLTLLLDVAGKSDDEQYTVKILRDVHLLTQLEEAQNQNNIQGETPKSIQERLATAAGRQKADELLAAWQC